MYRLRRSCFTFTKALRRKKIDMGVSTTGYKIEYTGNGSLTGPYSFPYYMASGSDLVVALDDVVQSSGFTVTGSGSAWNVNFTTAPGNLVNILFRRNTTNTQASDYQENDPLSADTLEGDLDKRTVVAQEIDGKIGNKIGFSDNLGKVTAAKTTLPDLDGQTNVVPNWNGSAWELLSSGGADPINLSDLQVSNFTAARAIAGATLTNGDIVYINGHTSQLDGGQGRFQWDATSTATDDNGTILKLTDTATGRLVRDYYGAVHLEWFGVVDDGVTTDDDAAFTNALAASDVIIIPENTNGFYFTTEKDFSGKKIIGAGKRKSLLIAADAITALRSSSSYNHLEGFTLRCNRTVSATWSSTAAKGIYVKDGPDAVGSAPTAYVENVVIKDVLVERFYENIEVRGAYWVDLSETEAIYGFSDIILNRSVDSSFTGTTLSLRNVWARGNGGSYTTPAGSNGIQIYHQTDVHGFKVGSERHENIFVGNTLQSGNLNGCYFEYGKYGPKFVNLTGRFKMGSVYYNNVGDQFSSGGFTLEVSYGQLIYEPHRFILTDDDIKIETSGEVLVIGETPDTTQGVNAAEYSYIDKDAARIDAITAKDSSKLGVYNQSIASKTERGLTAATNKSLAITIVTGAASDWHTCVLRLKCVTNEPGASAAVSVHYVDFVFSYIDATIVSISTNNILGTGVVSKTGQSVSGSDITVNIDIVAETNAWAYVLEVEAMAASEITSITIS